jgi:hypothetical protein
VGEHDESRLTRLENSYHHCSKVISHGRDIINACRHIVDSDNIESARELEVVYHILLLDLCKMMKRSFDTLTGYECSVSIKLVTENNEVLKFFRDENSLKTRKRLGFKTDRLNTATRRIINRQFRREEKSNFVFNRIDVCFPDWESSEQQDWRKYYNHMLAVPIEFDMGNVSQNVHVMTRGKEIKYFLPAVLTIDNKDGPFELPAFVNLALVMADYLFHVISSFYAIEQDIKNRAEGIAMGRIPLMSESGRQRAAAEGYMQCSSALLGFSGRCSASRGLHWYKL